MNLKSEKGFTGVEINIAVIIIFIFVSIFSALFANINSHKKAIQLKSEAVYIAIDEIETIKNIGIIEGQDLTTINEPVSDKEGFYKTITVLDYADMEGNEDKEHDIVKKITVEISYMHKAEVQKVELSTIISKEN